MLRRVSDGNAPSPATTPSELELAALVERLLGEIWWRVNSEASSGLSRTSASILKLLAEEGPQRVTRLAVREQVAQPTMSVIVKRLANRALVERRVDPADRRAALIAITPLGVETLRERAQVRSRWLASHLSDLDPTDRRAVAAAIEKLMASFT